MATLTRPAHPSHAHQVFLVGDYQVMTDAKTTWVLVNKSWHQAINIKGFIAQQEAKMSAFFEELEKEQRLIGF